MLKDKTREYLREVFGYGHVTEIDKHTWCAIGENVLDYGLKHDVAIWQEGLREGVVPNEIYESVRNKVRPNFSKLFKE